MKILITGGSGFVGSVIADFLKKSNHDVYSPNHEEMDCSDIESVNMYLLKIAPEVIIHTAAIIIPTDEMYGNHEKIQRENEELNLNVLQQAALLNIRNLLCFGSHTMYSPGIQKNESNILKNESPSFIRGYANSKRSLLKACQKYVEDGFNYKMLILPSIYGPFNLNFSPKQMLNSIILRAVKLSKKNQKILDVRGDLNSMREYIFLPDIANWVSKNIEILPALPVAMNLGTNASLPIYEYYKVCSNLLNLDLNFDINLLERKGLQDYEDFLDSTLASNFSWGLYTPVEEGIMRTIKYIEENYGI